MDIGLAEPSTPREGVAVSSCDGGSVDIEVSRMRQHRRTIDVHHGTLLNHNTHLSHAKISNKKPRERGMVDRHETGARMTK